MVAARQRTIQDIWGHLFVSLCACVLTVSIVGSAVFLIWRVYDRRLQNTRVEAFVSSLENRTPDEIAARVALLKAHPKVAKSVLPVVAKNIALSSSEQQQRSSIQIAHAFLDNKQVEKILFRLRSDYRESVAAAAVEALGDLQPPEHAVEIMGRCLADARCSAAVDEACCALYRLGPLGQKEMQKRLSALGVGRRVWLVGYVGYHVGPQQRGWLEMLALDANERVRRAASAALMHLTSASAAGSARAEKTFASTKPDRPMNKTGE